MGVSFEGMKLLNDNLLLAYYERSKIEYERQQ
jgi:hypothetical protein